MDKRFADEMIQQYQKKFFGFALRRTAGIDEAEELAARIVCEAYVTLRRAEDVYNWEGYLYRVASNVYARYVNERIQNRTESIAGMELGDGQNFTSELIREEDLKLLRREVAWLSRLHREIVLLHYYHHKKISEISEILNIPAGTVKWHLSDTKKQLREGMKKMRTAGRLGIEPIKLSGMGHCGTPGELGDTNYFLSTRLRQNIAYAAYFTPKTVEELGSELGVSPVYIEDEVDFLEDYGFLELLPGHKYRTNVFITDLPLEVWREYTRIDKEIAHAVCEQYVPLLMDQYRDYGKYDIYVPGDDCNYFMWSMVSYAVATVPNYYGNEFNAEVEKCRVKRKDGGDYIATANVFRESADSEEDEKYSVCGSMGRISEERTAESWSISTSFDTRKFGWDDNRDEDCGYLHMYMEGKMPKTEAVLDKYVRMYDRGLLAEQDGRDYVNVVVAKEQIGENAGGAAGSEATISCGDEMSRSQSDRDASALTGWWDTQLRRSVPALPEQLLAYIEQKTQEKVSLAKPHYPEHMHAFLKYFHHMSINCAMVLDELQDTGVLKPLSDNQKKGVNQIVFSDILPQ